MSASSHRTTTILAIQAVGHGQPLPGVSQELKRKILLDLINEHEGQCFSPSGNHEIVEFASPIDALHCAVEIQQAMLVENKRVPLERRVLLRMGLHLGDVKQSGETLLGEGAEVSVGLEALAVPGGICLSGSVYEHVKHKGHIGVEHAGEMKVSGALEAVSIYQVVEPGVKKGQLSLWSELKRRNVVRVGVAYTVVAWLMIQVADVILPTFDSPRWVMQLFISAVFLGFPVAVVLAWVYELTPVGLKRSDDVLRQASIHWLTGRRLDSAIISLLVLAVVFLVYENYVSKGIAELNAPEPVSVAVLAFQNLGRDANDEYFADGLADEVLSVLGRIRELKVASRTASFYYKDKNVDIGTIASTLMVGHILTGSVRREGNRVRITATLDDATAGSLVWTETYDETFEEILDIQRDIAQSVASSIVPVLSPESQTMIDARPTENLQAYDFYLRGREYLRQPAEEVTIQSAVELFNRATTLDSRFAEAYAGSCEAHLSAYEFARAPESFQTAEAACHRALTLDDSLWEVLVALGELYRESGRFDKAILELETAIAAQPNAVTPYLALAQTYAEQGNPDLAETMFLKADEVESGYWGVHRAFGNFLYRQSRIEEAIQRQIKVTELAPDSGIGFDNLGINYLQIGEFAKAEEAFNASPLPSRWTYMNRGLVYFYLGEFEKAVEDHKRAIDIAPKVHASWGFLGDDYRYIDGKEQEAKAAYDKAIELAEQHLRINPTDWRSVGQLGMYYAYAGRSEEAQARIRDLLEHNSDATSYYFTSRVRLQTGDVKGAYESLEKTVEAGWPLALLSNNPDFAPLRNEPGYADLFAEPEQ